MFLINSREGLFVATSQAPPARGFTRVGNTFSRTYGANLQSSLETRVLLRALEYSSHPTCVGYGTATNICLEAFSRAPDGQSAILPSLRRVRGACPVPRIQRRIWPISPTYTLRATIPSVTSLSPMRPPIALVGRYWNINQFTIAYPFRTRLRSRLTLH